MTFVEGSIAAGFAAWVLYLLICARDMMVCEPGTKEEEIDLRPWGYAPGGYTFTCINCPESERHSMTRSAAKRAWRCKEHALEARAKQAAEEPAHPVV